MRNKHSMGRRFLALLLCALMMVGLMPTTALAATTTVSTVADLQNAIKNAQSGDTIKLEGNITFNDSSKITTVADFYQNWEILTYELERKHFSEWAHSLAGVAISGWTNVYDPPWKTEKDFKLPQELRPEDGRSLNVVGGNVINDGYGKTRVREHGDATTYLLIKDKNLTIDLNGYTINASHKDAYFSALLVTGSSSVTIMDSRSGGGITSSGTAVTASGTDAKVTVNGGSLKGDTTAVAVRDYAEVHLNGGTFTGANVTEKAFESEVDLTIESRYETNDATFGYRVYHSIGKYNGKAIRTVPCGTLYCDRGSIYIGENQSGNPTFHVPGNGSLFSDAGMIYKVQISGGTFDTPPHNNYIVKTHCILQKDDGTCEVLPKNDSRFVARVSSKNGDIYCTSLSEAIKLAQNGSTVTLMKDISGEQILNNNSRYTLYLSGNTINGNVTVRTGNVTITGGTINYTGTGNALKTEGDSAVLTADCTVNASKGTALSAGYDSKGGTVNAIGGTYTGKLGTAAGGTLTITGGRYKNDPSAYLAEGLYAVLDSERYYAVTDSPFIEIWNKDDLLAFAKKVNDGDTGANAILMADIDLSGVTWTPIGNYPSEYIGTFNGNGHSIKNLKSTQGGLFNSIKSGGIVSDVTIASGTIQEKDDIGAIANWIEGGTIRRCFNYANVTGTTRVGGIVGGTSGGTIEQCGNHGKITGTEWVGGITSSSYAIPNNCYNVGQIEVTNAQHNSISGRWDYYTGAGGICSSGHDLNAINQRSNANNCFNYGTISANNNYFVPVSVAGNNNWHLDTTAKNCAVPGYTSGSAIAGVFARGDITWYLNNKSAEGVWYQTLGVDPYPVLDPTHARVYMTSDGLKNYTYNGYSTNPVTVKGGNTVAGITSQLPKTVTVNSDKPDGGLTAEVTWDTSPLSNYDPDNWEKQTFTLNGTAYVTGLKNGGEKQVQITVTVNAVIVDGLWVDEEPTKQEYIDGDTLDLSGIKIMVNYNDVNRTEVELSYDSPGLTFSIGSVNNLVTHGMVLDKNKHEGTLRVRYSNWIADSVYVKFLSTDNTIREITYLGNTAVLGDDGEYTLTLPKGTTLPGPDGSEIPGKDFILVRANDPYKVKSKTLELVEGRNNYWEITVVAESGHAATYYLEVLIDGWNKDAIDSLKQAWDDMDNKEWNPTQAEVQQGPSKDGDDNNPSYEMQLKAWLLKTMVERGMEIPANVTADISFTKGPDWATAGDRHNNRNGVNGKFEFSITFTATQGSEDTHETVTFDSQSGTITATAYEAPDYTVHFNSGGGSPVADLIVKEDDVIGENAPADPTFEHYTFLGWFTEQTGGEKWDMANDKVDRDNITLYAQWELTKYKVVLPENQHGYTLTADKEKVVWNESVTFTYKLGVGYNGDALVIKVNGTQVTPDGNGQFTVGGNVDSDIVVTVEGVINAPTYTVTIPESVNLDSTATVSAAGVNVAEGSSLYVAIGGKFSIANSNPLFKQTIDYPVHKDSKNGTQVQPDDTVLTVAGGIANNTGSQVLYFGLPTEEPKYADDYKGTVTFRIGIKDTE